MTGRGDDIRFGKALILLAQAGQQQVTQQQAIAGRVGLYGAEGGSADTMALYREVERLARLAHRGALKDWEMDIEDSEDGDA